MTKILSPKAHGYLDFVVVATFLLAPSLFNFTGLPVTLSCIIAVAHLGMTLFTRFPMGLVKLIPFPVHGTLELVASIALILAPYLFSFREQSSALWFYTIAAVVIFGVWATTDYKAVSASIGQRRDLFALKRAS